MRYRAHQLRTILASDEVRQHFSNNGMEVDYRDPRAFAVHIRDEIRRWTGVVQKADIRLDSK